MRHEKFERVKAEHKARNRKRKRSQNISAHYGAIELTEPFGDTLRVLHIRKKNGAHFVSNTSSASILSDKHPLAYLQVEVASSQVLDQAATRGRPRNGPSTCRGSNSGRQ